MSGAAVDERAEARADLRRSIAEARAARSLPSLSAFEGALVRALRVAQDGLAPGSAEWRDVSLALAMYDDGLETLMHRAQARAIAESGGDLETLATSLRGRRRGGHVAIGGAA